jgi:NAD+ kinase
MVIGIFGKSLPGKFVDDIAGLVDKLQNNNTELLVYGPFHEKLVKALENPGQNMSTFTDSITLHGKKPDMLLSLGGDGTFLDAVNLIGRSGIPVAGINIGRLGFLANISIDDISRTLNELIAGNYIIEERSLIELAPGTPTPDNKNIGLNEITIQKKDSTMITIHTYLNGVLLNSYWADGLIISTPTGSTAYSLSVGGPIVLPSARDFIIAPIAPHTLTARPIVVPDDQTISLKVESRDNKFIASVDHHFEIFDTSSTITVKKADYPVRIVQPVHTTFYETLRNKLMWGVDKRN